MFRSLLTGAVRPWVPRSHQSVTWPAGSSARKLAFDALSRRPAATARLPPISTRSMPWPSSKGPVSRAGRSSHALSRSAATQSHGFNSSRARRSARAGSKAPAPDPPQSLGARLRKLSREYGWTALGVYLGLSVLDFPFCFLLVKVIGTERIAEAECWFIDHVTQLIPESTLKWWQECRAAFRPGRREDADSDSNRDDLDSAGWGLEAAQERHKEEASLATQLALAYAIHKSFIFARVPLAAAVTPKVVKVLRRWGWQIGKRKLKTNR